METITARKYFTHEGTTYLIDENGWSYYQKSPKGPMEAIKTKRLTWYQKIWFKIKYRKTKMKYVSGIENY